VKALAPGLGHWTHLRPSPSLLPHCTDQNAPQHAHVLQFYPAPALAPSPALAPAPGHFFVTYLDLVKDVTRSRHKALRASLTTLCIQESLVCPRGSARSAPGASSRPGRKFPIQYPSPRTSSRLGWPPLRSGQPSLERVIHNGVPDGSCHR